MEDLTKKDIEKIVKDELKKFVKSDLDSEIVRLLKDMNSKTRKMTTEQIKMGIGKLAEFLYIRRNIWQNDIK
jgi:hypothetical protein